MLRLSLLVAVRVGVGVGVAAGCSSSKQSHEAVPPAASASGSASLVGAQDELERQTRQVVLANLPRLRACYEDALLASPDMTGRVILVIDVGQNGKATHVLEGRREGLSDDVIRCLSRTIKTLSFHDGAARTIRIQVPFNFAKRE
jgi:hypothetical protein